MEKTPRKSPILNKSVIIVDSPPVSSRPSGSSNECIVINSSLTYKVQQKDDYGADTKSKGKKKLVEDHYPHDSDFEDDIPLSKRLRVNNDQDSKVRNELEKFEKNVDAKFVEMKAFMDSSFKHIIQELKSLQNDVSTNKDLGGERSVALETGQTYVPSLVDVESENICVTPLEVAKAGKTKFNQFGVIEGENTFISPVQHVRTKIPGKYAQSPYTNLSESGGTSVNTVKYCLWRHPFVNYKGFDMYSEVILQFKKWVDSKLSKKRGKKTSFFTAAFKSNRSSFLSSVLVGWILMDWFHPLAYPGQPWSDLVISYGVTLY
uniref:Ulp1 protease family, C-terminal catalytic domain containing protein n=1 Tax=Solanum tuberosum TaxID=4113 RepID=M0ZPS6_SOLTU